MRDRRSLSMRLSSRRALYSAALVVVPLLFMSGHALAEPVLPNAEGLFAEGLKLAHAGDCAQARDRFAASYAADPAPGTLVNWALCEEKLGRSGTALELLRLADRTLSPNNPKRAAVAKHLDALSKRAPILRFRLASTASTGARVLVDDVPVESASLANGLPQDPGLHVIRVLAAGRQDRRYEAVLVEGRTLEMSLDAGDPVVAASAGTSPSSSDPTSPDGKKDEPLALPAVMSPEAARGGENVLGWVLAGVGVAAIGTGAVTGLVAQNKWSKVELDCDVDRKVCQSDAGIEASRAGQTLATISTIAFAAGSVSLAVGGYLLLTKKDAPTTAHLSAAMGPGVVGMRLGGQF